MSSISIYAELLLNIRQITVQVLLPSDRVETTSINLSSERDSLTVFHSGQIAEIRLPAAVRQGFVPGVDPRSVRELSLRLPVADKAVDELRSIELSGVSDPIWSASSLSSNARIACRACQALLVKDSVNIWKDLPSEDWAEMMDFWHCHKPETDDSVSHHDGLQKGYGAASSIEPTAGTGLLDTMYVLLVRDDAHALLDESSTALQVSFFCCSFLPKSCREGRPPLPWQQEGTLSTSSVEPSDMAADTLAKDEYSSSAL